MDNILELCPLPGKGVHSWIMRAAWFCRKIGMTSSIAVREIEKRMTRLPNPETEVDEAVSKVYDTELIVWDSYKRKRGKPEWPSASLKEINDLSASGIGVAELMTFSPSSLDENEALTEKILPLLYPGDSLLCVGSKFEFFTDHLLKFLKKAGQFPLIVPSPMLSKYGRTKDGKLSQHTLEATGPRRFLVIEGDGTSKDQQAAVLLHLAGRAPLTIVVDSGGKSLHGWFFVDGMNDDQLVPFFCRACTLGADSKLWTRSQFVRMPGGLRENGNRQQILFFNPETLTR